jgi:hypothetical protein
MTNLAQGETWISIDSKVAFALQVASIQDKITALIDA